MTSIADRSASALLVIDVQRDVVEHAHARAETIATIDGLVDRARGAAVPVIWVQHADDDLPADTPGWELADELSPLPDEPIVHKNYRDSFEQTDLESVLASLDVGHLIVTGAQTDFCIRWTLHGAHVRGYGTTLVADGHTTDDPASPDSGLPSAVQLIDHTNEFWGTQAAPGRSADVASASDIDFGG